LLQITVKNDPGVVAHSETLYRPDIDGLRAIAVTLVLIYHAFPHRLPGGFIGVDIFFVISGYLITKIIFGELRRHDFSLLRFYQRRVRRIFPALVVMTLSVFALGWYILPPTEFESLGTNIAGGAIFIQNLVLLGQVGYFDIAAEKKPLLHLWSLGIEEQYYLAWPLVLMVVQRLRLNAITVAVVLTITSFIAAILLIKTKPDAVFYLPFTRAWELFAGATLAIWAAHAGELPISRAISLGALRVAGRVEDGLQKLVWAGDVRPKGALLQGVFAALALAAIGVAAFRYHPGIPYPGYAALVPVVAAVILIATARSAINRTALALRPVVYVGLISYPLYLWHYPLLAFLRTVWIDPPRYALLLAVAASVALASLTYHVIERPLRRPGVRDAGRTLALLGAMAAVGCLGVVVVLKQGLPSRIPADVRAFVDDGGKSAAQWRSGRCLMLPEQGPADLAAECRGNGNRPLVFLWGDSYAASLYPGLSEAVAAKGGSVAEYTASACPALIDYVNSERRFCKPINDRILQIIGELRPDIIVLYSTWSYSDQDLEAGLKKTVALLRAKQLNNIIVLGPPATWKGSGLSANMIDYYYEGGAHALLPVRTFYRTNDEWTRRVDSILEADAKANDIPYISLRKIMCNDAGCLARIGPDGSQLMAFDNGHLTTAGSRYVTNAILPLIFNAGK
jgi:peptidoglycan/LPS O-acetylase OafA/YrhL